MWVFAHFTLYCLLHFALYILLSTFCSLHFGLYILVSTCGPPHFSMALLCCRTSFWVYKSFVWARPTITNGLFLCLCLLVCQVRCWLQEILSSQIFCLAPSFRRDICHKHQHVLLEQFLFVSVRILVFSNANQSYSINWGCKYKFWMLV